ncbi:hypothetical protein TIFTF001_013822 [Ficus carica]|uniref:Uncharacterized protein n=1 Tax=Ficus carica TaxID=3494 RepID=A0AA88D6E0_FICCA|nr:hypothetical protein TIFTF001_013822 [Ficus carica]
MGAFHWLKNPKTSNNINNNNNNNNNFFSSVTNSYEWEMKNLSSNSERTRREGKERENSNVDQHEQQHNNNQMEQDEAEETDRARCDWDFHLRTVVCSRASSTPAASDALGVIEFDPSDSVLATGGIARKIRIYRLSSLLPDGGGDVTVLDHPGAYDYYICTPAKLSSLRWRPGSGGGVLGSGDYDGVVTEYDLERKMPVFERDEHGGRRVWSVDYSYWDFNSVMAASGSDDGTMQMWDPRCDAGECVATVRPSVTRTSPVCCVEFNPFGGPLIAVGCADRRAYGYDVRKLSDPVLILDGHQKTVTYVRFLDGRTMVSSGTDGCLKLWNIEDARAVRTYRGHVNSRSFVGLSVWRNGGLLGCGSENNQVFVYDKRWGEPIWVRGFGPTGSPSPGLGCEKGFVGSVCWRQAGADECTLVAGGSDGALRVFVGTRKP